jgi:beta-hydroxylase
VIEPRKLRKLRRKWVRRVGKRLLRSLNGFFGRQSLVGDPAIFEPGLFPFTVELERHWEAIRDECTALLARREDLPHLGRISRESRRISRGSDWKVFLFHGFGHRSERNSTLCPKTSALVDAIPNVTNAWFSILPPHATVPAHSGISRGLLRCHLGLVIPTRRESCYMDIGDQRIVWQEGRCVVFDDMNEHSVTNDTDEFRAILLIDFHRPLPRPAALISRALLAVMGQTAYVRDGYRREMAWEEEFYAPT